MLFLFFIQNNKFEYKAEITFVCAFNIQIQILMHFTVNHTVPERESTQWQTLRYDLFEMVQQISKLITELITNATFIYDSLGINFDLTNMHSTMLRLLTPFQLLTYFRLDDPERYFSQKLVESKMIQQYNSVSTTSSAKTRIFHDPELINMLKGNFMQKYILQNKNAQKQISSKVEQAKKLTSVTVPHSLQNKTLQEGQSKDPEKWKFVWVNRQGMKPILGFDGERKLCQWIYEKLKKDEKLLLKDIAKKAKSIGKDIQGFGASVSWVHRFFDRYPDLFELFKENRKEQNDSKPQKLSDQQDMKKSQQSQQKSQKPEVTNQNDTKSKLTNDGGKSLIYDDDEDQFEEIGCKKKSKPKQSAKNKGFPTCQQLFKQNNV